VQEVTEPEYGDIETEYTRESESDSINGYWQDGDFIKYPVRQKPISPKIESMQKAIECLQRSKSSAILKK
jgi:hypothetical protein